MNTHSHFHRMNLLHEQRLLRLHNEAAEAAEAAEQRNTAADQARQEVQRGRDRTRNQVREALPERAAPVPREAVRIPDWLESKPVSKPESGDLTKAAITGAAILNPVGIATVAAGYAGYKLLSKIPGLSWVDRKIRQAGSGAWEGVKSVGRVGVWPLRFAKEKIIKPPLRGGYRILHRAFVDYPGDVLRHIQKKYDPDTNFLGILTLETKRILSNLILYPFKLGGALLDYVGKNPGKSAIGALALASMAGQPGGIMGVAEKIFNGLLRGFEGVINKVAIPTPAGAAEVAATVGAFLGMS